MRVTIIGTGTWGTTLAAMLSGKGVETSLWARTVDEANNLSRVRENAKYLPGVQLPTSLRVTNSLPQSVGCAEVVILAVPTQTMRANVAGISPHLLPCTTLINAAKGLEVGTGWRPSEIIAQELSADARGRVLVLSGPNLAREVAAGRPATSVVAGQEPALLDLAQDLLRTPTFRVYTNTDIIGVELAGALKNVVALAAGICDGLGAGDNAKAAIVTRGLAEMARLGVAAGAEALTFSGLAGLGDLMATCASPQSRNRYVGEQLARGRTLAEIQASMANVAEGVSTTLATCDLAARLGVDMPIATLMRQVLFEGKSISEAAVELMTRQPRSEFHGVVRS